jgi:ABC-type polysaccharide/polyol phosphate transport system ATPase subunit
MSADIVISARGLCKTYRLFGHPGDRVKQFFSLGLKSYHREFTALKDVSFDIKRGETIGIIGRNGSGKSTLLQMICGILKPTAGAIEVIGRISALLELGAGFNPEVTGRENVYFQGALMGFTKVQMDARFDEIAAFADIGEFIDQPVRTYSSGMFVRLAFAAMIHVDADILVIDEALAVGDATFQRKCIDKLGSYLNRHDKILLFVSHNLQQVERVCSKVIWLDQGAVKLLGDSDKVCSTYQESSHQLIQGRTDAGKPLATLSDSGDIDVHAISLDTGEGDESAGVLVSHGHARIVIDFSTRINLDAPDIIVGIHTSDLIYVASANTGRLHSPPDFPAGHHRVECHIREMTLLPGVYHLRVAILDKHRTTLWHGQRVCTFRVLAAPGTNPMRIPHGLVDMPFEWIIHGR